MTQKEKGVPLEFAKQCSCSPGCPPFCIAIFKTLPCMALGNTKQRLTVSKPTHKSFFANKTKRCGNESGKVLFLHFQQILIWSDTKARLSYKMFLSDVRESMSVGIQQNICTSLTDVFWWFTTGVSRCVKPV